MTIIEKIKTEIERLKTVQLKRIQEGDLVDAEPYDKNEAYNELLSFISTLEESERPEPYNPVYDEAYLNEKIKKATESWKGVDVDAMLAECRGYDEEKSEKPMNQEGLEDEIKRYLREECSDDDEPGIHEIAEHFAQWGAEHAREQMMKEAVECETVCIKNRLFAVLPMKEFRWTVGDKVRIIIVKED